MDRDSHQQLTSTLGVHITICDSDCTLGPEIRKHCRDLTFHFLQQCFHLLVFLSRGTENRLSLFCMHKDIQFVNPLICRFIPHNFLPQCHVEFTHPWLVLAFETVSWDTVMTMTHSAAHVDQVFVFAALTIRRPMPGTAVCFTKNIF